jgi:hypothetical protein
LRLPQKPALIGNMICNGLLMILTLFALVGLPFPGSAAQLGKTKTPAHAPPPVENKK